MILDSIPKRIFFDNNIWNGLVDGGLPFTVDDLKKAFHDGRLVVVSTLELFEEIMLTADVRPAKYKKLRATWKQLVSHLILLPMNLRRTSSSVRRSVLSQSCPASHVR